MVAPPISWWLPLSAWVAESDSVETEGALPVDYIPMIKSVLG